MNGRQKIAAFNFSPQNYQQVCGYPTKMPFYFAIPKEYQDYYMANNAADKKRKYATNMFNLLHEPEKVEVDFRSVSYNPVGKCLRLPRGRLWFKPRTKRFFFFFFFFVVVEAIAFIIIFYLVLFFKENFQI